MAYEKKVLNQVPAYITCTDIDRRYFRDHLGISTPAVVVPNGVDIDHYRRVEGKESYFRGKDEAPGH